MSTPQAAASVAGSVPRRTSAAAAREQIVRALGPLAASPLTEPAVARMRRAVGPGRFPGRTGRGAPAALPVSPPWSPSVMP